MLICGLAGRTEPVPTTAPPVYEIEPTAGPIHVSGEIAASSMNSVPGVPELATMPNRYAVPPPRVSIPVRSSVSSGVASTAGSVDEASNTRISSSPFGEAASFSRVSTRYFVFVDSVTVAFVRVPAEVTPVSTPEELRPTRQHSAALESTVFVRPMLTAGMAGNLM